MIRTRTGQSRLLLIGLACIALCSAAYFMAASLEKGENSTPNRSLGVGDQVSTTSAADTTQKDTLEIRGKSPTSIAPDRKKDSSGGKSTRQHSDLKKATETESSLDEMVIPPAEDGETGVTLREIVALHKQQEAEIKAEQTLDEFVIPPSEDGEPGLTYWELQALHEDQEAEMRADQNLDEFVIPPSEDGEPGLTYWELQALHQDQEAEMRADQSLHESVMSPSQDREIGLRRGEIQAIHEERESVRTRVPKISQ
jgi:hypothetical protein